MATSANSIRTVRVRAATRSDGAYAAHVGHDLLARGVPEPIADALVAACARINGVGARRVLLVHDEALAPGMVDAVVRALRAGSLEVGVVGLRAQEKAKSLASVEGILAAAVGARLERTDCFVALGGGIVGDVTGFAASVHRRGVAWCNIPTTLLAMVDASIGGKTGCNISAAGSLLKNMVGTFHDPALVVCDTAVLASLPRRELVAGMAECVKHAMIEGSVLDGGDLGKDAGGDVEGGPTLWSRLEALAVEFGGGPIDPALLVDLIADNLALKARVVGRDPFETATDGGRALLNLGHTFGHALETMDGLVPRGVSAETASALTRSSPISHGEAVSLGLVAACVAGEALGTCGTGLTRRVEALLAAFDLPTRVDNLSDRIDEALSRLRHDKKARAGSLRIIVPVGGTPEMPQIRGLSRVFSNPDEGSLRTAFERLSRW